MVILRKEGLYLWISLIEGMDKLKNMDVILDHHLQVEVDQDEGDNTYQPLPRRSAKVSGVVTMASSCFKGRKGCLLFFIVLTKLSCLLLWDQWR